MLRLTLTSSLIARRGLGEDYNVGVLSCQASLLEASSRGSLIRGVGPSPKSGYFKGISKFSIAPTELSPIQV